MTAILGDIGPCQVKYKGTDLGVTKGGVVFRSTLGTEPVTFDQTGSTPVDEVTSGRSCSVEVPLARPSMTILEKVLHASVVSSGKLKVSNSVGLSLAEEAGELILVRMIDGAPSLDPNDKITIHKAVPKENFEITFDSTGQKVYTLTFTAFPSDASGSVGELWRVG